MSAPAVLITRDTGLAEVVEVSAAAAGVQLQRPDAADFQTWWRSASLVCIGADAAAEVARRGHPARGGVFLVGRLEELEPWSAPLGAAVISLPDGTRRLTALFASASLGGHGRIVWLRGATGGLGVSSLAAGMAVAAARRLKVALVDLDDVGGGIDLLFGAEGAPGWRWPDLAMAEGSLGDLSGLVPSPDGVTLVSMGRCGPAPSQTARHSVLSSLVRAHDLVLVDGGAHQPPSEAIDYWVVGAEVRSVAAARRRFLDAGRGWADAVVVRVGGGRRIDPALVAESLGCALLGTVPTDRRLPRLSETGLAPGAVGGPFSRAAKRLVGALG